MQDAEASQGAAPVSDFTEDLLEALTSDDSVLEGEAEEAYTVKGAEGVELAPLPSYVNLESVAVMRSKCARPSRD